MNRTPEQPEVATQSWAVLAEQLERFIEGWESGGVPDLQEYLPADRAVRVLVLNELIKVDMEYRLQAGEEPFVEGYVARFPELLDNDAPPCDLVYEEFHLRRSAGHSISAEEYVQRFPSLEGALRRLMDMETDAATRSTASSPSLQPVACGERLDDFELMIELGRGAFAQVFLARQVSMQRLVALKVSADRGDEPQTLAQLEHPGVVRVYDQRTLADRGMRLMYMQLAAGGTLQDVIRAAQRLPLQQRSGQTLLDAVDAAVARTGMSADETAWRRWMLRASWPEAVCRLGSQLARALEYAHRRGVLHRDVKPANILLAADGSPKLADFNISFCSKLDGAAPAAYFGGSMAYMSPEQLDACNPHRANTPDDLDGRADLFSLAVVLWELLHGERPFPAQPTEKGWSATLDELRASRKALPPIPKSDGMTTAVTKTLSQCLSEDPDDRPRDGGELGRQLFLCTQPQSQRLLTRATSFWRVLLRTYSGLALAVCILLPHGLAGAFNYWFNKSEVIDRIAGAAVPFERVQTTINVIAFTVAAVFFMALIRPIASMVRARQTGMKIPPPELMQMRKRALRFPVIAGVVGLLEWILAGVAYPVALHWMIPDLTAADVARLYTVFLTSLVVCGLIAAAYPFFAVGYVCVRELYPGLLDLSEVASEEEGALKRLTRQGAMFLLIAAGVPMAAAMAVLIAMANPYAPVILIGAGIVGLIVSSLAYRAIARNVQALIQAVRPGEHWEADTESVSF